MNKEHQENKKRNIPIIIAFVLTGILLSTVVILTILNSQKTKSKAQFVTQDASDSLSDNSLKQNNQQNKIDLTTEPNSSNDQHQSENTDDKTMHSTIDLSSICSEKNDQTKKTEKSISKTPPPELSDTDTKDSEDTDSEKNQPGEKTKPSSEKSEYSLDDYNYVALTFDDGPYDVVDLEILELLDKYDGHATFFLLGSRIDAYVDTVKAIAEQGSEIANHSYNHPDFTTLSHEELLSEINLTNEKIKEHTDITPTLIRPPYGAFNDSVLETLPYPHILWNHDTVDWSVQNASLISDSIENTSPGSVILMHSLYPETLEALKQSLPILYEQGYRFVTVTDLYEIYGVPLVPHGHHNSPVDELGIY